MLQLKGFFADFFFPESKSNDVFTNGAFYQFFGACALLVL